MPFRGVKTGNLGKLGGASWNQTTKLCGLGSLYRNRRESYVNGLRVNIEKVVRHSIGNPLEDFDVGIMQPWSFERGKWCTPFFGEFSNA